MIDTLYADELTSHVYLNLRLDSLTPYQKLYYQSKLIISHILSRSLKKHCKISFYILTRQQGNLRHNLEIFKYYFTQYQRTMSLSFVMAPSYLMIIQGQALQFPFSIMYLVMTAWSFPSAGVIGRIDILLSFETLKLLNWAKCRGSGVKHSILLRIEPGKISIPGEEEGSRSTRKDTYLALMVSINKKDPIILGPMSQLYFHFFAKFLYTSNIWV